VPRKKLIVNKETIFVPENIYNQFSSLKSFTEENRLQLFIARVIYDFEYWAYTCVKISNKDSRKNPIVPFRLRLPQRMLLRVLMEDFMNDFPIRIILLKARQWGGSTLIQLFMSWLQLFHFRNWNSVIVTDVEQQAHNIRAMYSRMAKYHPQDLYDVKLVPFEGSTKNRLLEGRDCVISIASMQRPENMRSSDLKLAHFSEVASFKETLGKKPEDITQTIRGTIMNVPGTMIAVESTAKGVGNFFHREWMDAQEKKSGYRAVFVPWHMIEDYFEPFKTKQDAVRFAETLTPALQTLWDKGATLEGIQWYMNHKKRERFSDWRMDAEFPSSPEDAFSSTGKRAFDPIYVKNSRFANCEPTFKGEVFADAISGKEALKNIQFRETPEGDLWIWEFPEEDNMANQYVVSVDIGGRTSEADYSVIRVINRSGLIEGDVPRAVLTWKGHLDQDLVIWKAVQIARKYNNALLAPEVNSMNIQDSEGDHSTTLLDTIADIYDNVFCRTNPEQIRQGMPIRWGFHTNVKSKTDLITTHNKTLRENGYIEYDRRACDEYDMYEIKPNGSYGAVDGAHDDIAMCTMIGLKVSELMALPVKIERNRVKIKKPVTEAVI